MANHRMLDVHFCTSSKFRRLSFEERVLYYELNFHADDDGVVEAKDVLKVTDMSADVLNSLVENGYVYILDNDYLLAYIVDWNRHNCLGTKYRESDYVDLLHECGFQTNKEAHEKKKK